MKAPLPPIVQYGSVSRVQGPMVELDGVGGVGWDEEATVRTDAGQLRHGVVLEVSDETALVQVYEGTDGLRPGGFRVAFEGAPMRIPVGEGWLGRVCNGRGVPIDGGPAVRGRQWRSVAGEPLNPARRMAPADPIITGISAIDGLATLVRGQKLPIFSVGGLPHLELAAQIAAQAKVAEERFSVVFAAMGVTHPDAEMIGDVLETRAAEGDLALFINLADDPVVERILTPRLALTVAEHLAFDLDHHVLVVMADMTSYAEAVREAGSARGELPGRRGFPGYLYSDLSSLYERCGRLQGRRGSITQLPVLTMPAGDITHPVPDLTGYITEGQLVLSADVLARGVYPPFDPLASLSRLMRHGAGPGRTRDDHLALANQLYAALAHARQSQELAELIGADALSQTDRDYLLFAQGFDRELIQQGSDEFRDIDQTLDRGWHLLSGLPRRELVMLPAEMIAQHLGAGR
ncbi:MAG TPA: V-type ATP synthase subunit B [Candidatus Dormibacteraeota bacterium]|nr:V-type ATP synthase subunit B [Candidatus Dormibacteraeota bacterium]